MKYYYKVADIAIEFEINSEISDSEYYKKFRITKGDFEESKNRYFIKVSDKEVDRPEEELKQFIKNDKFVTFLDGYGNTRISIMDTNEGKIEVLFDEEDGVGTMHFLTGNESMVTNSDVLFSLINLNLILSKKGYCIVNASLVKCEDKTVAFSYEKAKSLSKVRTENYAKYKKGEIVTEDYFIVKRKDNKLYACACPFSLTTKENFEYTLDNFVIVTFFYNENFIHRADRKDFLFSNIPFVEYNSRFKSIYRQNVENTIKMVFENIPCCHVRGDLLKKDISKNIEKFLNDPENQKYVFDNSYEIQEDDVDELEKERERQRKEFNDYLESLINQRDGVYSNIRKKAKFKIEKH